MALTLPQSRRVGTPHILDSCIRSTDLQGRRTLDARWTSPHVRVGRREPLCRTDLVHKLNGISMATSHCRESFQRGLHCIVYLKGLYESLPRLNMVLHSRTVMQLPLRALLASSPVHCPAAA